MNIEVLASSSTGNCYLINDGESHILLDAGIRFSQLRKRLNFTISNLTACLITHEHQDHCRAVPDLLKAGVDCYMSQGTVEALNLNSHRVHIIRSMERFIIDKLMILPFDNKHDAIEPLGFALANHQKDWLLYLTDTAYCKYKFQDITHLIIEANFDEHIIRQRSFNQTIAREHKRRVFESHMSIQRVLKFLDEQDTSKLREIILCHLSDGNSDEDLFKRLVQEKIGCKVTVAQK